MPAAELSILVSWVLVPYADLYFDVAVEDYVATSGRAIVREMTQRCLSEPGLFVSAITSLGRIGRSAALSRPISRAGRSGDALAAELSRTDRGSAPVLIAWGRRDEVIPPFLPERVRRRPLRGGADGALGAYYAAADHRSLIGPSSPFLPTLMRWTAGAVRTRDDRVISDCAQLPTRARSGRAQFSQAARRAIR